MTDTNPTGDLAVHWLADCYPMMEGEEFAALVESIKHNGLRVPVVLDHTGTIIIDGRNRYAACIEAGIYPSWQRLPESTDLEVAIRELNDERRHMTPAQHAAVGANILEHYEIEAAQRQAVGRPAGTKDLEASRPQDKQRAPQARDHAAAVAGSSGRSVGRAKRIKENAPDLFDKASKGELSLEAAEKQVKQRQANKPAPDPKPDTPAAGTPVTLTTLYKADGTTLQHQASKKPVFNKSTGDGISWADWSWNPVTGCDHGCDYCYARAIATSDRTKQAFPTGFEPTYRPERLTAPSNTPTPKQTTQASRSVFVCSMADLFGKWVPDHWIEEVFEACNNNPQWRYIFLTKFPSRYKGLTFPKQACVGASVDTQRRADIIAHSMQHVTAEVRWLSIEPLLEPIVFADGVLDEFDWVVIGAQTTANGIPAFSPHFEWVAAIVAQARQAGCKVHLKPNLLTQPGMQLPDEYPAPLTGTINE